MALLTLACLPGLVSGCAAVSRVKAPKLPGSSRQKSSLTPGMVKKTIRIGKTTQLDVLSTFGAPNIVTRDTEGREVWTYDVHSVTRSSASKQRSATAGGAVAGYVDPAVVGAGGGVSGSASGSVGQMSSATFTLMITFDASEVVQDYRMMSTQF